MQLHQSSKCIQYGLIAVSSFIALPSAFAHDAGTRIAAVNVEKVFNESNMAKASQTKLQNEFTKRQNEIRDSAQKIKSAAEKLDRDSAVMSEAERARRQRELADQHRRRKIDDAADILQRAGHQGWRGSRRVRAGRGATAGGVSTSRYMRKRSSRSAGRRPSQIRRHSKCEMLLGSP